MKNTDATFNWDPESNQSFDYPREVTLRGPAEAFNKMQGCGLEVYGMATGPVHVGPVQAGPLILLPDSTGADVINWSVPATKDKNSTFLFLEKADFRIAGDKNLKTITLTDSSRHRPYFAIDFKLFDDSRVTLENLRAVFLGMSRLDTIKSPYLTGIQNSRFIISAEYIELFYNAIISGYSTLDVQANEISTNNIAGSILSGLRFNNNSSLLLNVRLEQHTDSNLNLSSSLSFYDSSYGNIFARTICNDVPDNNEGDYVAIDAFDNSTVDIHTTQFSQGNGMGKIIQLSGSAKVTINPLNNTIPIAPVQELQKPTGKCWAGMINFKSGSKATLTLAAATLQNLPDVMALNDLKIVYVDEMPVDILSSFNISFKDGIVLKLK
ncbi:MULTISPECIES: hypothetical protein [unclassified Escherichia]|uniref:hypothetical protein n=1 Tax=unclassified Escherichia TaxID=2608889 RepID=UPI0010293072|nr:MULTISPECIES: hypothetical protein [unclassified Escherichia]TGC02543.1 hypothetical protein CRG92_01905 [Escherichia sp. E2586]TLI63775.1 hypothetical protein FEK50_22445 [Escherichia sp. E2586]TLI78172.1 hypothetical protein FEK43_21850 [Escherichia sp. E2562]